MLLIDFLLLILTGVCIGYCVLLNKRIRELHNSRIEFARMIKELNHSISLAENNVKAMNEISKVTSKEFLEVSEFAGNLKDDLLTLTSAGAEMLKKLTEVNKNTSADLLGFNFAASSHEKQYETIRSKKGEKFVDDDLLVLNDEPQDKKTGEKYTDELRNFIRTISSKEKEKEKEEVGGTMDQKSYYDTLRKISTKKYY